MYIIYVGSILILLDMTYKVLDLIISIHSYISLNSDATVYLFIAAKLNQVNKTLINSFSINSISIL